MTQNPEQTARPQRWLPDLSLPPYAHLPGQTPHPASDPRGHRFADGLPPLPSPLTRIAWDQSLLIGIELFNHRYFWEAHEVWEQLWKAVGRTSSAGQLAQGLIKLAAAGVKYHTNQPAAACRHARRGIALIQSAQTGWNHASDFAVQWDWQQLVDLGEQIAQDCELAVRQASRPGCTAAWVIHWRPEPPATESVATTPTDPC